jgi:Ca-activated chloride channel family protein
VRRFRKRRQLPVRERLPLVGGLLFWLCALTATSLTIVALARPIARVSLLRSAGVDLVILQDGSASMHVTDVAGDRWQRSMRFLRVIAESLRWKDDRVAMALFAHIAAPQIRLTRDPNTLFFFLDHLDKTSPFPLEDDTTWDTNIEAGIYWGTRLFEKDEQLQGKSPNGKVFVLVSDGQAWSGQVANALRVAQARGIPVFVVGVGTAAGGQIPEPAPKPGVPPPLYPPPPIHATLDRASLLAIAQAGSGEYFELDRDDDHDIANRIIDAGRRRAGSTGLEYNTQDLYWQCLLAAACLLGIGVLFLQERVELALSSIAAVATLALIWAVIR